MRTLAVTVSGGAGSSVWGPVTNRGCGMNQPICESGGESGETEKYAFDPALEGFVFVVPVPGALVKCLRWCVLSPRGHHEGCIAGLGLGRDV